jgi:hypothetical protein
MEQKKCGECGGDIGLRYQISDRDFYIESNVLKEDTNTYFEPTFVVHCMDDMEHDIEKGLKSNTKIEEFFEWKKRLVEEAITKFNL